jgi:drug/metabolite transporter (DMT)-like permease
LLFLDQLGSARVKPVLPAAGFALLAGLTIIWGTNWPVMKIVLSEVTVWWFRSACLIIGGVGLLTISGLTGSRASMPAGQIKPLLACSVFNIVGWHICSGYGVLLMPPGRAAIIAFTMPVWAALFARSMLGETLTKAKLIGLVLGVAGLATLIGPDLVVMKRAPLGALFMLLSALSWAYGTVLFKRIRWSIPVASNVGWQLLVGSVPVTIGASLLEPAPDITHLSPDVLVALAYVLVFTMLFGQWAYFQLVNLFPASIAAIGTLGIPIVGVLSSALMLGEAIGGREFLALALVCASLASVLVIPAVWAYGRPPRFTYRNTRQV